MNLHCPSVGFPAKLVSFHNCHQRVPALAVPWIIGLTGIFARFVSDLILALVFPHVVLNSRKFHSGVACFLEILHKACNYLNFRPTWELNLWITEEIWWFPCQRSKETRKKLSPDFPEINGKDFHHLHIGFKFSSICGLNFSVLAGT